LGTPAAVEVRMRIAYVCDESPIGAAAGTESRRASTAREDAGGTR
jgi:hypothetical protein